MKIEEMSWPYNRNAHATRITGDSKETDGPDQLNREDYGVSCVRNKAIGSGNALNGGETAETGSKPIRGFPKP